MMLSRFQPTQLQDKENKQRPVNVKGANAALMVNMLIGDQKIAPLSTRSAASVASSPTENMFINIASLLHNHAAKDRCFHIEIL